MTLANTKPAIHGVDVRRGPDEVLKRLRAEFLEMPGMSLTPRQVQRLFGIDETVCRTVLDALVEAQFLCVKPAGSYARLTDRDTPWPGGLAGGQPGA
jgi:hypothetical protein